MKQTHKELLSEQGEKNRQEGMCMELYQNIDSVLIPREEIQQKVKELGDRITKDYAGKRPLLVCILKGSVVFFSDLIRQIALPLSIDFMAFSSYQGGTEPTKSIKLVQDLGCSIVHRHVIIVEDIVDTGNTLHTLIEMLGLRQPESVVIAALLNKTARREVEIPVRYYCFDIPDEFVVGYGMDYGADELYRNLPDVCVLKKEVYTHAK